MPDTVLFLCTGNYFRSRFAEHYFNEQARLRNMDWQAASRGLQPSHENLGFMSRDALDRLCELRHRSTRAAAFANGPAGGRSEYGDADDRGE